LRVVELDEAHDPLVPPKADAERAAEPALDHEHESGATHARLHTTSTCYGEEIEWTSLKHDVVASATRT
jgi:hypothetical protein